MIDVSIIIVNWNTRDILRNCLASVFDQTRDISFEVIVVDNASQDGSADMVKSEFDKVILIENKVNRGFAAANNQGLAVAKGRFLLLLNSDTVVLENAIDKTVVFADQNKDCAVTGCRVLNKDMSLQRTCFMFPSVLNLFLSAAYLYKIFPRSRFFGREEMTYWNRDDVREVDVVTGCFMLIRREAIEKAGALDEQYFVYGEETDLCYRIKKAGYKILFTPDAKIIHLGGASSKQVRPQMMLQLRGSILLFCKKHYNKKNYCLACIFVALFFALRAPYWFLKSIMSSERRDDYSLRARTLAIGAYYAFTAPERLVKKVD